jgi:hypothetical protein
MAIGSSISSGQGYGITKPGRAGDPTVKPAKMVDRAAKANKVKSIKIKFGKKGG